MQNLRIQNVVVTDSTSISITFTDDLTPNLIASNVSIITDTTGVPSSEVTELKINGAVLMVTCQPLTPLASYFIELQSVPLHPFESINGDALIVEDGISNKYAISGPLAPENPIKNYLDAFLYGNIYNNADDNTLVAKYIKGLATILSRALYDIRQAGNENYLSFNVIDELKTRGEGPFDRLDEESAYEIMRVGRTPAATAVTATFPFEFFPSYPVTLQRQFNSEILTPNSIDDDGFFNINTFTFNFSNSPLTRVDSIIFSQNTINPVYVYDIEKYGYQIKNSRYDQDFGFSYLQLEDNQIKISEEILKDPLFDLNNIINITVKYETKNLGVVVDDTTLSVYTISLASREVLPPIINVFNLKHAPVVNSSNEIPTFAGVTFINPNNNVDTIHPAFKYEVPYRLNAPPASPGQYSVDYSTGTVYVYGAGIDHDGTGPFPPLATYKYRYNYKSEIDYVYDPDSLDLVSLPHGSLTDFNGNIRFSYEEVLIPGVDYNADLHIEQLQERIENRITSLNSVRVENGPITNVFKIFNETTGEIYNLDRWSTDKIYFKYNTPPRIFAEKGEKVTFNTITNELLFVNTTITNVGSLRIFKIFLNNNTIVSSTEDSIASSFNTSLNLSDLDVFVFEKWFDPNVTESSNVDRLLDEGEYMVDYINGVIYCAVSSSQSYSIGTATYKNNIISTNFPHIISVEDIFYRISPLESKNKQFAFTSFTDSGITPETLDPSSEEFLNDNPGGPYQINNGDIGIFISTSFLSGVTNQVKFVRSIYEFSDLQNSTHPFNFGIASTSSGFDIAVTPVERQFFDSVQFDGSDYYINVPENIPYLSPNITYTFSVVRVSDSAPLWDLTGTVVPGNPVKLILPGINSPSLGDQVNVIYTIEINDLARVVVDYNKGDYFVDYTYLGDEIVVSYEYGDNVLDFRTGFNLSAGENYYVSYKAGALRDALLKNFGTLVNIPELTNFDVDFNRERYRDALSAALTSFIQGPTVAAIKNIGKTISHIEPEVIESAFLNWSLGSSLLVPESITTTGEFEMAPGKHGNGVVIDHPDQTIKIPFSSNFRMEEGTFETWIEPKWAGIDNDARLTFSITKDGYVIPSNQVFIGAGEFHPEIEDGVFTLDKNSNTGGTPNMNKDGVFIYYDKDISGSFNRWYVRAIDGYVDSPSSNYKFKITSTGSFYDNKSIILPKPSNLSILTGGNYISFSITGGPGIDEGVTFVSDIEHFILDAGQEKSRNRLSVFKDISGYVNFRVYDQKGVSYTVSADVSDWRPGDLHHVAVSWKLNNYNSKDELHLFIDGFEVPNIIKYGQKLRPYLHEKFRTVDPEEVAGLATRDIVGSVDLVTTAGSNVVTSSINFNTFNIFPGDKIYIDESGFDPDGYVISLVSGQSLTLASPMSVTLTDGKFSVNRTSYTITSEIDIVPNIAVATIHTFLTGNDGYGSIGGNTVSSLTADFVASEVQPGYLISVDAPGFPLTFTILQVTANTLTIDDTIPANFSSTDFQIYDDTENEIPGIRAIRPSYSISKDGYFNNILTVSNNVFANDLVLIRTLGLNFRRIRKKYYVWSDDQENVLMTQLPAPISLDEAEIRKVIVSNVGIGPTNSTLSLGVFVSNNLPGYPTSNAQEGRSISVTIGGNNTDFTTPVAVTINGLSGVSVINETIYFTDYGTQDFTNLYLNVNYIQVNAKPISSTKPALTVEAKEKYSITYSENSGLVPVVKYSYHIGGGSTLRDDGYGIVTDDNFLFSYMDTNNYLVIHSPISVAGFYLITGVSEDRKSLFIQPTNQATPLPLPSFTNGIYQVFNVNEYRSGLQNGFFTFEASLLPSQAYFLNHGFYELDYATYTRIQIDPLNEYAYFGSDSQGHRQLNGLLNELKVYSTMLTDTRVGESIPANQRSITKDFNSLKAIKKDANTLLLIDFNTFPFTTDSDVYTIGGDNKQHFLAAEVINENFGNSIVILKDPIKMDNDGILNTRKQGTIEFWMNPIFDTANDPNDRFYFDAYGAIIEEAVSVDQVSVKLSAPASQILSVKLKAGDQRIDYFAGGKVEVDTQHAIQEVLNSATTSSVVVTRPILQVIAVKIVGDLTETDYFATGVVGSDQKTIYLGKTLPSSPLQLQVTYQTTENKNVKLNSQVVRLNRKLPYQNTRVVVNYIPSGLQGDRLAIFKDKMGYMNFGVTASGTDYVVRAPTRWAKNTWHRVKASYKFNSGTGTDELRLFLDGYEYTNVTYGTDLLYGKFPVIWGASSPGGYQDGYGFMENIRFRDPINELFIGSQYTGENPIFSLIDNLRISDISRPLYTPFGESLDVNYSTNLDTVFPVTSDLFTTFLLDFDKMISKNSDFAILKNRKNGLFDFSVNILDSFGIVNDNIKSQEALEALIKVLKPANSRVFIQYIR